MFHVLHKTFGHHKVSPQEKTTNSNFDLLYQNYKSIEKEMKVLQSAVQGTQAGWKKINSANLEYIKAYENVFKDDINNKKNKKKNKKAAVKAVSIENSEEKKEDLTGHLAAIPDPVMTNDDFVLKKANEQYNLQNHDPTVMLNGWFEKAQKHISEAGKLPQVAQELNFFFSFLAKINAQITKRNDYVADLDYYKAKLRDCQLVKDPEAPKAKSKIYETEAKVKALQETYEQQERICALNMNKAIEMKYDITLRATAAFLTTQAFIFNSHPFDDMSKKFLERHAELSPALPWPEMSFEFVEQDHKIKTNKKNKGGTVQGVSLDSVASGEKSEGEKTNTEEKKKEMISEENEISNNEKGESKDETKEEKKDETKEEKKDETKEEKTEEKKEE